MRVLLILFLKIFCFGIISCQRPGGNEPIDRMHFLMDTLVRISIYDQTLPRKTVETAIDRAFMMMKEIEERTSVYVDTSEITRLVEASGIRAVGVSSETLTLLKKSVEVSDMTHGAFDITVGVIKSLWGFDTEHPTVPDSSMIQSLLSKVNYKDIHFQGKSVLLRNRGMRVDLGGIAKGLIIDRGVDVLREAGIQSGIIEAGGDLRIFGNHPVREKWNIAIRHPRSDEGAFFGVLATEETGIATSGDYERYFYNDGKRYHHILDPQTGYPAEGCISVTVVAESALLADAYATAVFVLGIDEGMALIDRLPSVDGIIIYEEEDRIQYKISERLQQMIEFR